MIDVTSEEYRAAFCEIDPSQQGSVSELPRYHPARTPRCALEGCTRWAAGQPSTSPENRGHLWQKPGKYCKSCAIRRGQQYRGHTDAKGYVVVRAPGHPMANAKGTVMAHRLVMADHLGRALHAFENVHHINGDRTDNRIDNLELWCVPQPAGQRFEDLVDWIIEKYADTIRERLGGFIHR